MKTFLCTTMIAAMLAVPHTGRAQVGALQQNYARIGTAIVQPRAEGKTAGATSAASSASSFTVERSAGEMILGNPEDIALSQNFPNPFSSSTAISFRIASEGRVLLRVFDFGGREVRRVVDENLTAGHYAYEVQAADLPAGTYIYRLEFMHSAKQRMMAVVK